MRGDSSASLGQYCGCGGELSPAEASVKRTEKPEAKPRRTCSPPPQLKTSIASVPVTLLRSLRNKYVLRLHIVVCIGIASHPAR